MTAPFEIAYAKINLALHVRRRADDGYHDIETLFAFCADGDVLTLADRPGLTLTGPFAAALGDDPDNLVTRAAAGFAAAFGVGSGAGFVLNKCLPVAAGVGGGSADAAAALRLLARVHRVDAQAPEMGRLSAELGADVPACLQSRSLRGTGRGDVLVPAPVASGMPLLLVNPRLPLSTGAVFGGWDGVDRGPLGEGPALAAAIAGRNDLEPPARALRPEINRVLDLLAAQAGVQLARMSGSGATCFALFDDAAARDAADRAIAAAAPGWWRLATALR